MRVKITVFVPVENADAVRQALGSAGAGQIGGYSYCSFTTMGTGRFTPSDSAQPHVGNPGELESVSEERIEVVCDRKFAKEAMKRMKAAHPYEEVAFDIVELLEEANL